jgi:hypothetical protein
MPLFELVLDFEGQSAGEVRLTDLPARQSATQSRSTTKPGRRA